MKTTTITNALKVLEEAAQKLAVTLEEEEPQKVVDAAAVQHRVNKVRAILDPSNTHAGQFLEDIAKKVRKGYEQEAAKADQRAVDLHSAQLTCDRLREERDDALNRLAQVDAHSLREHLWLWLAPNPQDPIGDDDTLRDLVTEKISRSTEALRRLDKIELIVMEKMP